MKLLMTILFTLSINVSANAAPTCKRFPIENNTTVPYDYALEFSEALGVRGCPIQVLLKSGDVASLFKVIEIDLEEVCAYRTTSIAFYCEK